MLVTMTLLLSACGEKDLLLGTWQEPVSQITLKFDEEGNMEIGRRGASYTVQYEKQEPNLIAVTSEEIGDFPVKTVTYQVSEDQLVITVDNVDTVFYRIK
jgi:hypothetical protein